MFNTRKGRLAFENCPNRYAEAEKIDRYTLNFQCTKYPEPRELSRTDLIYKGRKNELAQVLGCVACPYRDKEFVKQEVTTVNQEGTISTETSFVPAEHAAELDLYDPIMQEPSDGGAE